MVSKQRLVYFPGLVQTGCSQANQRQSMCFTMWLCCSTLCFTLCCTTCHKPAARAFSPSLL